MTTGMGTQKGVSKASLQKRQNLREEFKQKLIEKAPSKAVSHPVFNALGDIMALATFMEYYAFSVWDYMNLLKSFQNRLNPNYFPWRTPKSNLAALRYLQGNRTIKP